MILLLQFYIFFIFSLFVSRLIAFLALKITDPGTPINPEEIPNWSVIFAQFLHASMVAGFFFLYGLRSNG